MYSNNSFPGVIGGLDLHGKKRSPLKTHLTSQLTAGQSTITLEDAPFDWEEGNWMFSIVVCKGVTGMKILRNFHYWRPDSDVINRMMPQFMGLFLKVGTFLTVSCLITYLLSTSQVTKLWLLALALIRGRLKHLKLLLSSEMLWHWMNQRDLII